MGVKFNEGITGVGRCWGMLLDCWELRNKSAQVNFKRFRAQEG